jgi:hypothetical protein
LGTGWEKSISAERIGNELTAELLRDDLTAATHSEPAERLASAAELADRLETLAARRAARQAEIARQEAERQAEVERQATLSRAAEQSRRVRLLKRLLAAASGVLIVISGLLTLKGHSASVTCVAFSADGLRLASASFDGAVKVWDVAPRP